jgi:arginine-tRNA-protein transferase
MILDHVRQARETATPYVYLGYWVGGSAKMAYKARFDPIELLRPSGWLLMTAEERAAAGAA